MKKYDVVYERKMVLVVDDDGKKYTLSGSAAIEECLAANNHYEASFLIAYLLDINGIKKLLRYNAKLFAKRIDELLNMDLIEDTYSAKRSFYLNSLSVLEVPKRIMRNLVTYTEDTKEDVEEDHLEVARYGLQLVKEAENEKAQEANQD